MSQLGRRGNRRLRLCLNYRRAAYCACCGGDRDSSRQSLTVHFKQLVYVSQTRVLLRLEKEHRVADHFHLGAGEHVGHLGVDVAAPGPAADVIDTLIVDCNDRDFVVRVFRRGLDPHVVGFSFQTLQQISTAQEQEQEDDDYPQKPIGFPKVALDAFKLGHHFLLAPLLSSALALKLQVPCANQSNLRASPIRQGAHYHKDFTAKPDSKRFFAK